MKRHFVLVVLSMCVMAMAYELEVQSDKPDSTLLKIKNNLKYRGKNSLQNIYFRCSMENPGVCVVLSRKSPRKISKKAPSMAFYVNGKQTRAVFQNDSTYFVHINSMQRWSVGSPVTYSVTVVDGKDRVTRQFGIHDMSVRNGMISINDSAMLHKGLTDEALPFSSMISVNDWYAYFKDIKSKGFTVISLNRSKITNELMIAADKSGIMVHARVTPFVQMEGDVMKKTGRRKRKLVDMPAVKSLADEFIEHPSLCMATFMPGTDVEISDKYLLANVFNPLADSLINAHDYAQVVDTTMVCIADFSDIKDEKNLTACLEKTFCTKGIGVLLFSSIEQSSVWKDIMIQGKFDRDEWDSSMSMTMDMYFTNNSNDDIRNANFYWEYTDESGFPFSYGTERGHRFLPHTVNYVLTAFSPLEHIYPNDKVTLRVWMEDSNYERSWSYTINFPAHILRMNEEAHNRMREWCKRNADETEEEYRARVNDVTKTRMRRILAYDIVTSEAKKMFDENSIRLSDYNRNNNTVIVTAGNLPAFKLKVPQQNADEFLNGDELELRRTRYGLNNKDSVELVYAEVHNKRNDVYAVYENYENEENLNRILVDDELIPSELKELAEHEDSVLQQIKKSVIQNAIDQKLITEGTKINVSAHFKTDYDEKGEPLNNYQVVFEYDVDEQHSLSEDYAPGHFLIEDSHAAISMLHIISNAFEKDFARYVVPEKKLDICITGSADSSPIRQPIAYNACYGEFLDESYFLGLEENKITITAKEGIHQNEQLAYMRSQGVRNFLEHNLPAISQGMKVRFLHNVELPMGRGGKYRRIKVSFTFIDVFNKNTDSLLKFD